MSSPGFEPIPTDPNEALLGAEFDATSELLTFLHLYHESANDSDDTVKRSIAEMATSLAVTPVPPVEPKFFVARTRDPEVLEQYEYWEMEWTPRESSQTAAITDKILVRYPRPRGSKFEGIDKINDILIEINGYRYLLNDKGVISYADGESLIVDESEIESSKKHGDRPNVFIVDGEYDWAAPELTAVQLHQMLLLDSTYSQREHPES